MRRWNLKKGQFCNGLVFAAFKSTQYVHIELSCFASFLFRKGRCIYRIENMSERKVEEEEGKKAILPFVSRLPHFLSLLLSHLPIKNPPAATARAARLAMETMTRVLEKEE